MGEPNPTTIDAECPRAFASDHPSASLCDDENTRKPGDELLPRYSILFVELLR